MFRTVEPYLEPIDIFDKIGERKSELSDEGLGFICGLIKEKEPRKIVEIGVSAGGTSCVILNCLEKLNLNSEVYSIDISYTYHYDAKKKCGYQIENAAKYLNNMDRHILILGKSIAEVLDQKIGDEIDMLILDTTHYLPGELLDFLVCLPYLSSHAVVILDDLTFAHWGENTSAIATKILFDIVVADKIFPQNVVYPKMGGYILNEDTRKYKADYFSGLMTPWWYEVPKNELDAYRKIIIQKYEEKELLLFDEAVRVNTETLSKKKRIKTEIQNILSICERETTVLIYGAGQRGTALGTFLKDQTDVTIGYVISDDRNKDDFGCLERDIYHLSEVVNYKCPIFVAVADDEVRLNLEHYHINYVDVPNFVFPFIKQYAWILRE